MDVTNNFTLDISIKLIKNYMKIILIIVTTFFSTISFAQEVYDYSKSLDNLRNGARIGTSLMECAHFGFKVVTIDDDSLINKFVFTEIINGMNTNEAKTLFLKYFQEENEKKHLKASGLINAINKIESTVVNNYLSDKVFMEFIDYWWERCDGISKNFTGSGFITNVQNLTAEAGKKLISEEIYNYT